MRQAIDSAARAVAPHVRRTPCRRSAFLSERLGRDVHLKLENLQETASFKLRGVVNKVVSLSGGERRKLLVAASTGNHGMAFAHVVEVCGLKGRLFIPGTASSVKVKQLLESGIPFEKVGDNCVEAENAARRFAEQGGHVWLSPYNDLHVIAGQGTVAVELLDQVPDLETVYVPVGGGGLISGMAAYLKAAAPSVRVVGCQPVNSCVMYQSLRAGAIVEGEERPTISDGTAGGIEKGSRTFELCRRFVDDFVLLEEREIEEAIRLVYEHEGLAVEGAAALSVAALIKDAGPPERRRVAAVLSGGRISPSLLRRLCEPNGPGSSQ